MLNVKNKAMICSKNQHWKLRNVMKYHTILTILNLLTVYFATVNHELNVLGKVLRQFCDNAFHCRSNNIGPCSYIVTNYNTKNVINLQVSAL